MTALELEREAHDQTKADALAFAEMINQQLGTLKLIIDGQAESIQFWMERTQILMEENAALKAKLGLPVGTDPLLDIRIQRGD